MAIVTSPTLSITGTVKVVSPKTTSEDVLSATFEGVEHFDTLVAALEPGETSVTVNPPHGTANYLRIDTNRKIRYRLNGGSEDFVCSRMLLDVGTEITALQLNNDQLATPEKVYVTVSYASGGDLV